MRLSLFPVFEGLMTTFAYHNGPERLAAGKKARREEGWEARLVLTS